MVPDVFWTVPYSSCAYVVPQDTDWYQTILAGDRRLCREEAWPLQQATGMHASHQKQTWQGLIDNVYQREARPQTCTSLCLLTQAIRHARLFSVSVFVHIPWLPQGKTHRTNVLTHHTPGFCHKHAVSCILAGLSDEHLSFPDVLSPSCESDGTKKEQKAWLTGSCLVPLCLEGETPVAREGSRSKCDRRQTGMLRSHPPGYVRRQLVSAPTSTGLRHGDLLHQTNRSGLGTLDGAIQKRTIFLTGTDIGTYEKKKHRSPVQPDVCDQTCTEDR